MLTLSPPQTSSPPGKIQLSAAFAIFAAIAGSISTFYLFGAICFRLDSDTLKRIAGGLFLSAAFSGLTFVAASFSLCELPFSSSSCEDVVHLGDGGVAMIFSIIFFLAAAKATLLFDTLEAGGHLSVDTDVNSQKELLADGPERHLQSIDSDPGVLQA